MDVKDKDALYALKAKELKEADKIYMKGFKAAIDYLVCKAVPEAQKYLCEIDNFDLRWGAVSSFNNHSDYFIDNLYGRMFYEMDATLDYYADNLIPDDDDIDDPIWYACEKIDCYCPMCDKKCAYGDEKYPNRPYKKEKKEFDDDL